MQVPTFILISMTLRVMKIWFLCYKYSRVYNLPQRPRFTSWYNRFAAAFLFIKLELLCSHTSTQVVRLILSSWKKIVQPSAY